MIDDVAYVVIPDYPMYRVGTDGSLWSRWLTGKRKGNNAGNQWKKLNPKPGKIDGYPSVSLSNGITLKWFELHELILITFVGPRPNGKEGCHRNGIGGDNRLENLYWGTHAENLADRNEHGTMTHGERNGQHKLTENDVLTIRAMSERGQSSREIAESFPQTRPRNVRSIVAKKRWAHV